MSKAEYPSDKLDQYMVRFPEGMRDRLKDAASQNNRSMNAEIIERLESTFKDNKAAAASALAGFIEAAAEALNSDASLNSMMLSNKADYPKITIVVERGDETEVVSEATKRP